MATPIKNVSIEELLDLFNNSALYTITLLAPSIAISDAASGAASNAIDFSSFGRPLIPSVRLKDTVHIDTFLDYLSPRSYKSMVEDIKIDDKKIKDLYTAYNIKDKDYEYYEPTFLGVYLEYWICLYMRCPGCNGTFVKYANPNMPVIDIRCSNKDHNIHTQGPKYYQVKTTNGGYYKGLPYFYNGYPKEDTYIHVGSQRFGYKCHRIKYNGSKELLIGYICISYDIDEITNTLQINNKSFLVVPNNKKSLEGEDKYYYNYKYVDENIICVNNKLCDIIPLKPFKIDTTLKFDTIKFNNIQLTQPPVIGAMDMTAYKYYKYKYKYIGLKNQLN